ncbi:putative sugar transporter [Clostridium sp. IBUN13A]|nr:hypothetical protein ClosIBUN125C_CONTIG19g01240 [Clostridium sp. IBUN125C]KJZ92477.1 hypothetical protein ClosIBUN22A_CONTIG169g03526 [Clostridium sp. IBUN22A]KJZ94425.1 putative sugar transporter [Clostridium sp. IBUN13A]
MFIPQNKMYFNLLFNFFSSFVNCVVKLLIRNLFIFIISFFILFIYSNFMHIIKVMKELITASIINFL